MSATSEAASPVALDTERIGDATYDPEDNKLRIRPFARLPRDLYDRVKAAGFSWAPKQELFVAPMWTPERADLLAELCGEIGDEDTSLVDRAEERADRFGDYSDKRKDDAETARQAIAAIADHIPLGQPILVGHHSEKHARKDAERIENGMRKAVKMWETSQYWQRRAAGALRHAKYKELPAVRARRIKTIEADKRKRQRETADAARLLRLWGSIEDPKSITRNGELVSLKERAMFVANHDHIHRSFPLAEYPRQPPASQYEGQMGLWSALDGDVITPEQARDIAVPIHERGNARRARWIAHYDLRIAYERAMLADAGGTVTDKKGPEKGGACRCWASPRGGWSYIQKVNRVSVTILDNWDRGDPCFNRTIKFEEITSIMTAAEVKAAREDGRIAEIDDRGFALAAEAAPRLSDAPVAPIDHAYVNDGTGDNCAELVAHPAKEWVPCGHPRSVHRSVTLDPTPFEAMKASLKSGVRVVAVDQLFETPADLARLVVERANVRGHFVLEPSAGLGALAGECYRQGADGVICIERAPACAAALRRGPFAKVCEADFLQLPVPPSPGWSKFYRIVMNPPFADGADVAHVTRAYEWLASGGRLVAIMSASVKTRQDKRTAAFRAIVDGCGGEIEDLPEGSFKASGTGVNTVLVTLYRE